MPALAWAACRFIHADVTIAKLLRRYSNPNKIDNFGNYAAEP